MKKLLLLITGLFILASVEGQILRYSNYTAPTPDFYDEFDPVYAAFASKPHIDTARFMEALVYSLDTAGYWDRMNLLHVYASHEESPGSLINWINPGSFDATAYSDIAWEQYKGYTGDGIADYLSTNWSIADTSANSNGFGLDHASIGIYMQNNEDVSNDMECGNSGTIQLNTKNSTGYTAGNINSTSAISDWRTDASGLFILTRTAINNTYLYRNGVQEDNEADVRTTASDTDIYILAKNSNNTAVSLSSGQVSIFFIMDSVTSEEAVEIMEIINTYMTAIGSNTYNNP